MLVMSKKLCFFWFDACIEYCFRQHCCWFVILTDEVKIHCTA